MAHGSSFSHSNQVESAPRSQTAPTTGAALPASVLLATETKQPLRASVQFTSEAQIAYMRGYGRHRFGQQTTWATDVWATDPNLNLYSTNHNNDHNSTNPNPKPNLNLVSPKCLHTFVTNTIYTSCRKASHILFSLITISQQLPSSNVKSLKIHVPPRRQLSTFRISL